jgi:uncharacterized protein (DUF58 family)
MNQPALPATIRPHSRLWPVAAVFLLFLQLVWPSRTWMILLIIFGGSWSFSYWWARSLAHGLHLEREMRYGWAQVGDRLEQRFSLTNKNWAPALWLEVDDHSDLPEVLSSRVTAIGGNDSSQWKIAGTCNRRGLYTIGPTNLRSGDPLGFFSVETHISDSTVLLVLPPVLPLPAIEVAAGGRAGESRRARRSALETTVSVDTVREYIPGDALRSIHWPTSARRDSLYVRQFEHTPSSDWWIFLDMDKRVQTGEGSDSTVEHGVILAASLADKGLRQGHAVGLVTCGKELAWITPQHQSGQLMDILRTLAVVTSGETCLADLLSRANQSLRHGASLILITPDVTGEWLAPLLRSASNQIASTVFLFDPVSFGGSGNPNQADALLNQYSIAHTIVRRELLNRPEARPGMQGQWEWRTVGPGRAVPVRQPKDSNWRQLG